jgi:hypothetical protein
MPRVYSLKNNSYASYLLCLEDEMGGWEVARARAESRGREGEISKTDSAGDVWHDAHECSTSRPKPSLWQFQRGD